MQHSLGRSALLIGAVAASTVFSMQSAAVGQASGGGTLLVAETFTEASADERFQGYGSACLTGATQGGLGDGLHQLRGCPAGRVGPVPPVGGAPFGFLELTDAANDRAGAVLFDEALPATEGLEVTFDQYQYGSTTPASPADGISFFLVDGSGGLSAPGAFGGSLGYAQKEPGFTTDPPFIPGVDNGYLGVGLDVLGNFFGDWERRGDGCAQPSPSGTAFYVPAPGENMVTVRGPGNGTEGYCFLTATSDNFTTSGPWNSTLTGDLQGPTTAIPGGATAEEAAAAIAPSKRTVTIRISPAPSPRVTVLIDFLTEAAPVEVLDFPAPEPVPDTYKFGFAASTGLFTDVHLIGGLTVRSERPLPLLELTKTTDTGRTYRPGDTVTYAYTVTNTTGVPVTDLRIVDDRIPDVTCESTTLARAGEDGDATTCTGTYVVTEEDGEAGSVTNVATVTGSGGTIDSDSATVTVDTEPCAPGPGPDPGTTPEPDPSAGGSACAGGAQLAPTGPDSATVGAVGAALVGFGIAFALWARRRRLRER